MHKEKLITNYKLLTMLHLNDKWEEKGFPKFKAIVNLKTSKGNYKIIIRATYFDLCMMVLNDDWVILWFHKKATKAQLSKFMQIYAEAIKEMEVVVEDSIEKDVAFGLDSVDPRIVWTNDRPFMCGAITLFRLKRFIMASIYYTSTYASNAIRHLVRDATVRSIVDAYKFGSEDAMTWAFGSGVERDSCIRLRKYFRPIKRNITNDL